MERGREKGEGQRCEVKREGGRGMRMERGRAKGEGQGCEVKREEEGEGGRGDGEREEENMPGQSNDDCEATPFCPLLIKTYHLN